MKINGFQLGEQPREKEKRNFFVLETNHLGNVMEVVSDRKISRDEATYDATTGDFVSLTSDGIIDYFEADVVQYSDYYPYGFTMPGRNGSIGSKYRYQFQGMETDPEMHGTGNSYTTQFRQYDPRLGRWKSLDPLAAQFPWQSPFNGMDDNPVALTDPLGLSTGNGDDGGGDGTEDNPYKKGEFSLDDLKTEDPQKREIYYTEGGYVFKAEYITANGGWEVSHRGANSDSDWTKSNKFVESNYAKQNTGKSASNDQLASNSSSSPNTSSSNDNNSGPEGITVHNYSYDFGVREGRDKDGNIAPIVNKADLKELLSYQIHIGGQEDNIDYYIVEVHHQTYWSPWNTNSGWKTTTVEGTDYMEVMRTAWDLGSVECLWCEHAQLDEQERILIGGAGAIGFPFNASRSAVGGRVVPVQNSPYLIVQKGDRIYHISRTRVKEYVKNPANPNARWGDQVNFKKYGVPKGSVIIKGAGKGHKRTPTALELEMYNKYFR